LLEVLLAHLKQKSLLLILDNCEYVVAEAATVAVALLCGCPHLWILVTSREPLRIAGEQTYRLPSLRVPAQQEIPGLSAFAAADYAAVVLFVQRAQASDRGFALSDDNAPSVADICWRLDGIPRAIELAAARVNIFSVWEISQKLDQRFQILTGGDRTALPRHQTMRALIDWSYDLLSPQEQRLFESLSVFAGGCTMLAAADVFAAYDGQSADRCIEPGTSAANEQGVEAFDILSSLVDQSLVVADLGFGESRTGYWKRPERTRAKRSRCAVRASLWRNITRSSVSKSRSGWMELRWNRSGCGERRRNWITGGGSGVGARQRQRHGSREAAHWVFKVGVAILER